MRSGGEVVATAENSGSIVTAVAVNQKGRRRMKEVQKETEKEEILDELAAQDTLNQAQKQKYND